MFRTPLLFTVALLIALSFAGAAAAQNKADEDKVHKLVIHLTSADPGAMNRTINNARNVSKHYGIGNIQIEIVANGPGLKMFHKDSKLRERLAGLHALGNVNFAVCANTMKAMKWTKADLLQDAFAQEAIVPAGLVRVIELQESGWSYSRP